MGFGAINPSRRNTRRWKLLRVDMSNYLSQRELGTEADVVFSTAMKPKSHVIAPLQA
jgi:hypothetical protein